MSAKTLRIVRLFVLTSGLLIFGWGYAPPTSAATMLGQTASANVIVDGSTVPSGTTLLSPSVLETRSRSARVVLSRGQILEFDINSRAHLETTPWGELEVVVDGGSVMVSSDGESVRAFASQRLVFVQPEVQIAQLGGLSQAVHILPVVALASGGCTVNASGTCSSGDGSCNECVCKKKDPATGVCEECVCDDDPETVVPADGKGLKTVTKVGIGVGAAVGVALLIDSTSDDDEPPASPVN